MSPRPLTRKEQQARTRDRLLAAAGKVFCRKGLAQGSVDDVAREAGYTKGAFYANFKSKEELFLAMLDERFADRLREFDSALAEGGDAETIARRAAGDFARAVAGDPEWQQLFFEFTAHALREPAFREELVTRYRALRARIAERMAARAAELGIEPPVPVERLALMLCAMANGFALERLLEPDVPADLHPEMLGLFFAGVGTLLPEPQPSGS